MEVEMKDLPKKVAVYETALEDIFEMRIKAQKLKDDAKDLEEVANVMFQAISDSTGVMAVISEDVGSIRVITKATSKVDQKKVKDYLLKKGVDSTVIADAYKKATTTGSSVYVGFFPKKK